MPEKNNADIANDQSFWKKYKWIVIIVAAVVVAVVIALLVYFLVIRKKEGFMKKESFTATDQFNEQYDYANSYINSVLGGNVIGSSSSEQGSNDT